MEAEIRQAEGLTLVGKADSGHWVVMDGPPEFGGNEAGTKPMELLLISLGGCTGMDVISILNKMRVDFDDVKIEVSGTRREEYPQTFTEVHVKYKFWGDVSEDKVKEAIEKSQEKYCGVSATLRGTAEVTYDYEIIEE